MNDQSPPKFPAAAMPPDVFDLVCDPATSHWLRANVIHLITQRDPLDALHDAEELVSAMTSWTRSVFRASGVEMPEQRH